MHLELLNNYGDQIGSDFIVPGITSFDKLHRIFATAHDDYRVELDYTVADPKGGTQVKGLIYDTSTTGDYATLSGGGECAGTPFDDTFIDGPGNYTINGGGGDLDTFQINQNSDHVLFSLLSPHQLGVSTYSSTTLTPANLTGTTTLTGFTRINLNDETILESASGRGVRLEVQGSPNFAGTLAGFAAGDSIVFDSVGYAPGDHAVFTSNGSGGGTVAIDTSGGTQVASFKVQGTYPWSQLAVSQASYCGSRRPTGRERSDRQHPVAEHEHRPGLDLEHDREHAGRRRAGDAQSGAEFSCRRDRRFQRGRPFRHPVAEPDDRPGLDLGNERQHMKGGGPVSPNPGPSFHAVGTGDFNHDGFSDILWQNTNTGQASIWEMNGNTRIGGGAVTPNPGLAWKAIGTGDFNHDGDLRHPVAERQHRPGLDLGNGREHKR